MVLGRLLLIVVSRFFLLQMCRVRKKNSQEIQGRGCSVNGSAKALFYKTRQIARVIDMRVCQNNGVNRARIDRRILPVPQSQILQSLKEPAVHQEALACGFNEEL